MAKRTTMGRGNKGEDGLTIENIASEVGRFFGTTELHARRWLEQRKELLDALASVRDRASALMAELGYHSTGNSRKGRKRQQGIPVPQPGMRPKRRKRVMSAATRAKMREAAKRRWAVIKKKAKVSPAS